MPNRVKVPRLLGLRLASGFLMICIVMVVVSFEQVVSLGPVFGLLVLATVAVIVYLGIRYVLDKIIPPE